MLMVAFSQEKSKKDVKLVDQIKKLIAGTHAAILIQAPDVKKNTKGRPSTKKAKQLPPRETNRHFRLFKKI
jgi:hypothetical protein